MFITVRISYQDEQGVGLSDEEIRAEVDTFVFEGHDTTASGLAWTLYNLAIHPEHQAKCREEVDALFDEKENEDLTWYNLVTCWCNGSKKMSSSIDKTQYKADTDK